MHCHSFQISPQIAQKQQDCIKVLKCRSFKKENVSQSADSSKDYIINSQKSSRALNVDKVCPLLSPVSLLGKRNILTPKIETSCLKKADVNFTNNKMHFTKSTTKWKSTSRKSASSWSFRTFVVFMFTLLFVIDYNPLSLGHCQPTLSPSFTVLSSSPSWFSSDSSSSSSYSSSSHHQTTLSPSPTLPADSLSNPQSRGTLESFNALPPIGTGNENIEIVSSPVLSDSQKSDIHRELDSGSRSLPTDNSYGSIVGHANFDSVNGQFVQQQQPLQNQQHSDHPKSEQAPVPAKNTASGSKSTFTRRNCLRFDWKSWIVQQRCPNWVEGSRFREPEADVLFDLSSCEQTSGTADNTSKKSIHQVSNKSSDLKPHAQEIDSLNGLLPSVPVAPVRKEDMLSFSEWRRKVGEQMDSVQKQQQQLLQLQLQQQQAAHDAIYSTGTGHGQTGVLPEALPQHVKIVIDRARNFASHECGAKIVDSNQESQFGNRALNEQKDDYMLNPCHVSNWFVVELCETIQPQYLEIANFELYSSIPKEFSVQASEHYPPRGEWSNLGANFTAQDVRTLQGFKLLNNGFVKYLKISLRSYYGDKHFCPISVVRVFGTSLFDEVDHIDKPSPPSTGSGNGNGVPSQIPAPPPVVVVDSAESKKHDDESSTVEEKLIERNQPVDLIGNAKNVLNIIMKALNFNLFKKIIENVSSDRNQTNPNFDIRKQSEVALHYRNFEAYLNKCEHYFMENPEIEVRASLNIPKKCRFLRFTYHTDLFDQLYTQYFIRKYVDPDLFQQCGINQTYSELNATRLSQIITQSVMLIRSRLNNTLSSDSKHSQPNSVADLSGTLDAGSLNSIHGSSNNAGITNRLEMNINLSSLNYGGTLTNVVTNIESSQIQPTIMQTVINTLPLPEPASADPISLPASTTTATFHKDVSTASSASTSVPESSSSASSHSSSTSTQSSSSSASAPSINNIKDVEVRGHPSIALPLQDGDTKELLSSSGGHSKEAVIVRLNNRIKSLESNISLMSAYLEDLSVRYRTQMEEMQMMFNRTIDHLNNTAIRAAEKDSKQQVNIMMLEAEIIKLRIENKQILLTVESKNWTHLKIHLALMFFEFFLITLLGIIFYLNCSQVNKKTEVAVSETKELKKVVEEKHKEVLEIQEVKQEVNKEELIKVETYLDSVLSHIEVKPEISSDSCELIREIDKENIPEVCELSSSTSSNASSVSLQTEAAFPTKKFSCFTDQQIGPKIKC